jgi:BolA family transcriptional regulator, general stress-responsive regulator
MLMGAAYTATSYHVAKPEIPQMTGLIAPGPVSEEIGRRLATAFAPAQLSVTDDSASHHGHGGHKEGVQTHLAVMIEAQAFAGLSRVTATRLVQKELKDMMDPPVGNGPIHALTVHIRQQKIA